MPDARLWDIYTGQAFLTPGAADTIDLISRTFALDERSRVLEIAYGTGEGACRLAERHRCRVLGVDMHPFAKHTASKAAARGVADQVAFAIGDGGRLPVRDAAFDAAICIGAPSIVGTERCLAAMRRALRPGGWLAVSDWVWRATPVPPQAIASGFDAPTLTLDGYAGVIRAAAFEIVAAEALPQSAWDDYYAPIRKNLAAMRAADPGLPRSQIDDELRIWDSGSGPEWWVYGVFVARAV
jgi:SAM-dependent methyltransferase